MGTEIEKGENDARGEGTLRGSCAHAGSTSEVETKVISVNAAMMRHDVEMRPVRTPYQTRFKWFRRNNLGKVA